MSNPSSMSTSSMPRTAGSSGLSQLVTHTVSTHTHHTMSPRIDGVHERGEGVVFDQDVGHLSDGEDEYQVEEQLGEGDPVRHLARGRPEQLGGETRQAHRRCPFRGKRRPRGWPLPVRPSRLPAPQTPSHREVVVQQHGVGGEARRQLTEVVLLGRSPEPGFRSSARTATSTGRPTEVTASRNAVSRVSVDPAMEPPPGSLATPSVTITRSVPSRYSPSAEPVAAIASVISAILPAAPSKASRTTAGCTCTPSLISSSVTARESIAATTGPGARWWMPGIALNACVRMLAPASNAALAMS